jgi:hypothetical protein
MKRLMCGPPLKLFAAIIYERAFSPAIPIRTFDAGFKTHAVLLFSLFRQFFKKRSEMNKDLYLFCVLALVPNKVLNQMMDFT